MLGAATGIFKMEVPAAGKSTVPTWPMKPLGKKISQARRSQFNGSIRVLSSPANSEVVWDGIEKRGECVATERSGLAANKVLGNSWCRVGLGGRRGRVSACVPTYRGLFRGRVLRRIIVSAMSTKISSPWRSKRIRNPATILTTTPDRRLAVFDVTINPPPAAILWIPWFERVTKTLIIRKTASRVRAAVVVSLMSLRARG